jgi:hypothetical protein
MTMKRHLTIPCTLRRHRPIRKRVVTLPSLVRVAAALALAGCGAGASAETSPHLPITFPDLGYRYIPPHIPPGISPGTVLVVDLTNFARVKPANMRLASDSTFSGARWTSWGAPSTTGQGTATIRICSPSCGGGHDANYPATVVLSDINACRSHRFYETARVTLATVEGPKPWGAVLRAPC